ncbi:hypothetical protein M3P05_11595 [Sansalvadorimonas sp. 2012CJ34-2]|uniref:Uncharacterized protein n=1 Tax=Parendozoicomonas callyspongiae TaxID=2942213 RepID=A0ABT0PGQ7_9GAMM|nr:hypothetical protein [Sansalvadorimonas sp. 2012CJ34-2]MCL6270567.1 hypothetical protein [Sansalvadorimonas sp. 2012CJ34-2]
MPEAMKIASELGLDIEALMKEQDEVHAFDSQKYITSLGTQNPDGNQLSVEQVEKIRKKVILMVLPQYQTDREPLKMDPALSPREWRMVQNALTKQVVDILAGEGGANKLNWGSSRLVKEAARQLGIPQMLQDKGAPINKFLRSRVRISAREWFEKKGFVKGTRS